MLSKYEINETIDKYIERIARAGIVDSFYPNAVKKALNIPLTLVIKRLNRLVDDGMLELKFEIRCHEGFHIIDTTNDYGKYLEKEEYCMLCGDDIYIDLSNITPIYYIESDYINYLKKKKRLNPKNTDILKPKEILVMS